MRAVTEAQTWHSKIGRLQKDVTEADVVAYLRDHTIAPVKVEQLRSKQGSASSMHIEVPF